MTDRCIQGESQNIGPVLFWAGMYLKKMRNEWPSAKLAVVFDIDDTAINTSTRGDVHPEFKQVYDIAVQHGYNIFFVTARPEHSVNVQWTVQQLLASGFLKIDGLRLMPPAEKYDTIEAFSLYKYRTRYDIFNAEYNIVLNVGDS